MLYRPEPPRMARVEEFDVELGMEFSVGGKKGT
jgi:hypothetical protein